MKRRGFFARLAVGVAGLIGIPSASIAARSVDAGAPRVRFKIESNGKLVWLSPVLSHVIDEETRRRLAKPISQMIDAVSAELDNHPVDHRRRTDPEGIALNQVATTLVELKLALIRKYPW